MKYIKAGDAFLVTHHDAKCLWMDVQVLALESLLAHGCAEFDGDKGGLLRGMAEQQLECARVMKVVADTRHYETVP